MIDIRAGNLWGEVQKSIEQRDSFLGESYWEAIKRFFGPAYNSRNVPSQVDFENHAFTWISIFLPILASGNPRVRGKSMRQGSAAAFAKATELAQNRNFELEDIKRTIEQLATDWAFKYCVSITSPMPLPGISEREDPRYRPTSVRLSLEDYVWDMMAKQHAACRFQAHRIIRDKEDLLREAEERPERGWNEAQISKLQADKTNDNNRKRHQTDLRRGEVEYWEVWVPEFSMEAAIDELGEEFVPTTEAGYNGTIVTIAQDASDELRPPRPFWGPREGPYTYSGYLYVPDEVVPVSPLVGTSAQAEIYNAVLSSAIESIKDYKKGIAVKSDSGNLSQVIAGFVHDGIMTIDAMDKLQENMQQIEVNGVTPQVMAQLDMLRVLLERASGITENQLGIPSGASTATEASIAQMSTAKRMGYMTEKFIQTVVKPIARKESWYLTMDPRSRTSLGDLAAGLFVDPRTGIPIEMPVLVGGPESGSFLEDYDVDIEPISMRYTSEMLEAEKAASWEAFLFTAAPMMPQLPHVDWGLVFSKKAEQLGDPSLARAVDVQKAMLMGQLMMGAQLGAFGQPLTPTSTPPQGRLGIDIQQPRLPQVKSSESARGFSGNARIGNQSAKTQISKGPRQGGESARTTGAKQ